MFMTHFTNEGRRQAEGRRSRPRIRARSSRSNLDKLGGELICARRGRSCAPPTGPSSSIAFQKKLGVGLFGGEGFILQKLKGDGLAFIHSGGTIIERELRTARSCAWTPAAWSR